MNKAFVDILISNMKRGDLVTKASAWMVEGTGEKETGMNVRYVGIKVDNDWNEVFSKANNLLLKFIIDRSTARIEFYLANKPPFFRIISRNFKDGDKWETILGEVRSRLKKDKAEYIDHKAQVGNLYVAMKPHLK